MEESTMGSLGDSSKAPDPTPTPPEPELVKRTEAEVVAARNNAKAAAAQKYGISGTNVTKGALSSEAADTKKKTLGGS
jgi:hypothetical protein